MQENEFFVDKDRFTEAEKHRASKSLWYYSWIRFKRNKLAMAGLIILILLILIAVFARLTRLWNMPPVNQDLKEMFS